VFIDKPVDEILQLAVFGYQGRVDAGEFDRLSVYVEVSG
jgi:hypothetical protein